MSGKEFYKNAKNATLTCDQFFFNSEHPYNSARKKLPCLKRAPELTNTMVCVLKDMQTLSITYKLSVTNLEFTLGLVQQTGNNGNAMPNRFIPMTLRVEDSSVNVMTLRNETHIMLAFVQKDYHNQGIGKALFEHVLHEISAANNSASTITVNASPYSVGFYEKLGFTATSEEQEKHGIRFLPMKYAIEDIRFEL